MKKAIIPILSGLAVLVLAYGARQFYLLYKATFKVVRTKIKAISSGQISLVVFAEIDSKSDVSAVVNGQHYDVFLNNELVSRIDAIERIHINSNGKTIIPININFNPSAVIKTGVANLANLLLDRSKVVIEIKGYLSMKVGIVELKNYPVNIKYTLQELIDISKEPK